jgi:hypothetical protein
MDIGFENQPKESTSTFPWSLMITKDNNSERIFNFINKVMDITCYIIFGSMPPRISSELKKALHISLDTKIGDWYLFENHTILRTYGFQEEPYFLPAFLTLRIYSLEFFRHRFVVDYDNFVKYNKPITFKLPYKIYPFTTKSRTTKTIAKELLGEMKLQKG